MRLDWCGLLRLWGAMSVVRCEGCEKYIDTDFDGEHFINNELVTCEGVSDE